MENKKSKKGSKNKTTNHSIRVCKETYDLFENFRELANKTRKSKETIKQWQVVRLAGSLLKEEHMSMLQKSNLKYSDRQKIFKQKYFELHNTSSDEDFMAFTETSAYSEFVKEHQSLVAL